MCSRKRAAREVHRASQETQKMFGHKAKLHHAKRHSEKIQMKKTLKAHDERNVKQKDDGAVKEGALPAYLLDREGQKVRAPSPTRPALMRRMPKLSARQSRTEERTERPNTPYLCPRFEVLQRRKCSRSSRRVNTRGRAGNVWSTRLPSLERASLESLSSSRSADRFRFLSS